MKTSGMEVLYQYELRIVCDSDFSTNWKIFTLLDAADSPGSKNSKTDK